MNSFNILSYLYASIDQQQNSTAHKKTVIHIYNGGKNQAFNYCTSLRNYGANSQGDFRKMTHIVMESVTYLNKILL